MRLTSPQLRLLLEEKNHKEIVRRLKEQGRTELLKQYISSLIDKVKVGGLTPAFVGQLVDESGLDRYRNHFMKRLKSKTARYKKEAGGEAIIDDGEDYLPSWAKNLRCSLCDNRIVDPSQAKVTSSGVICPTCMRGA